MKKLIMFFSGLLLLALMFGALVVAGVIYDTGAKTTIDTYFFQPDDNANRRPGVPVTDVALGANKMRDLLISKYITEYFYVMPDLSDVQRRREGRTSLSYMSTSNVFSAWLENVAPQISELAASGALRTVSLVSVTPDANNNYWAVEYELRTWRVPNNFNIKPEITRGTIYMAIIYEPDMRKTVRNRPVEDFLESGNDPAAAFRFGVIDVASHQ